MRSEQAPKSPRAERTVAARDAHYAGRYFRATTRTAHSLRSMQARAAVRECS